MKKTYTTIILFLLFTALITACSGEKDIQENTVGSEYFENDPSNKEEFSKIKTTSAEQTEDSSDEQITTSAERVEDSSDEQIAIETSKGDNLLAKAWNLMKQEHLSQKVLTDRLIQEGFDKIDVKKILNQLDINWNMIVILRSREIVSSEGFFSENLESQLKDEGFTTAQIKTALATAERNAVLWTANLPEELRFVPETVTAEEVIPKETIQEDSLPNRENTTYEPAESVEDKYDDTTVMSTDNPGVSTSEESIEVNEVNTQEASEDSISEQNEENTTFHFVGDTISSVEFEVSSSDGVGVQFSFVEESSEESTEEQNVECSDNDHEYIPFMEIVHIDAVYEPVHYDAVTEQGWVVDQAAYDEEVVIEPAWEEEVETGEYIYACNQGDGFETYNLDEMASHCAENGHGYYSKPVTTTVYHEAITNTVHHDEVGHYETIVLQEAYDDMILVEEAVDREMIAYYQCLICGKIVDELN